MRRFLFAALVVALAGTFALAGGCTLNPDSDCPGGDCSDLNIVPGDIAVPCDSNADGVTDCVTPNECRDAANTMACTCIDSIGTTCVEYDPTCVCAVPPVPACGDGNLDAGEVCDDGNNTDGDGCSANCLSDETCGNSIVDTAVGEVCDDGNTVGGDGCSATCQSEACGNGTVDVGEVCDDGNNTDGDGCSANCLSNEACGNSYLDTAVGEVCDDGNTAGGDGCSANCLSDETCGNSIVDSLVGEVCDDGNNVDGDGCSANCLSDETCGNSILDAGEVCDDGNTVGGDGCSADCLSDETCGNGIVDTSMGEECDDGNTVDGDGCSASCILELCGNGVLDSGEDCDGGTGCDASCACPDQYFPDGGSPPGCSPCDVGGVCQSPASNYCAATSSCWVSCLRVALPSGGTIYIRTGAGLEFPEVVPAGQYREIGLMGYDLGADFWCTTSAMSVEVCAGSPNMDGVWLPGEPWPTVPGGPPTLTNVASFNVTTLTDAYWSLAP